MAALNKNETMAPRTEYYHQDIAQLARKIPTISLKDLDRVWLRMFPKKGVLVELLGFAYFLYSLTLRLEYVCLDT